MLTPESLPVLAEITLERDRQLVELGWTPEHDDLHGAGHLALLASRSLTGYGWPPRDRAKLVKAAALLVAAIEVLDRTDGD